MAGPRFYVDKDAQGNPVVRADEDGVNVAETPIRLDDNPHNLTVVRENEQVTMYVDHGAGSLFSGGPKIYYVTEDGYLIGEDGSKTKLLEGNVSDVTLTTGPDSTPYNPDNPDTWDRQRTPPAPVFYGQPADAYVAPEQDAVFVATPSSGSIRWYEVGVGAMQEFQRDLTIPNVTHDDNGRQFYAVATSFFGSSQSNTVTLEVGSDVRDPYWNLVEILCHFDEIDASQPGGQDSPDPIKPTGLAAIESSYNDHPNGHERFTRETGAPTPRGTYWQYARIEDFNPLVHGRSYGPYVRTKLGNTQPLGRSDFCFECWVQGGAIPVVTDPHEWNDIMAPLLHTGFYSYYYTTNYWFPDWRMGLAYTDTTGKLKWGFHKYTWTGFPQHIGYIDQYPDSDTDPNTPNHPGLNVIVESTTNIRDGEWHQICIDRRDGVTRMFVDGVLEAEAPDPWDYGLPVMYEDDIGAGIPPGFDQNTYGIGCTTDFFVHSEDIRWGGTGGTYLYDQYPSWMGAIGEMRLTVGASRYSRSYNTSPGGFPDGSSPVIQLAAPLIPAPLAAPAAQADLDENHYVQALVRSPLGAPAIHAGVPLTADILVPSPIGIPTLEGEIPRPRTFFAEVPGPLQAPAVQAEVPWSVVAYVRSPIGAPKIEAEQVGAGWITAPSPLGRPALKVSFPSDVDVTATVPTAIGAPRLLVLRDQSNNFEADILVPTAMRPAIQLDNPPGEVEVADGIAVSDLDMYGYAIVHVDKILSVASPETFYNPEVSVLDTVLAEAAARGGFTNNIMEMVNTADPISLSHVACVAEILRTTGAVQTLYHGLVEVLTEILVGDSLYPAYGAAVTDGVQVTETALDTVTRLANQLDNIAVADTATNVLTIAVEETAELQAADSVELTATLMANLLESLDVYALIKTPSEVAQGWVMNTDGALPVSEYDNYNFASLTYYQGQMYGASDTGLYTMSGDTDEGDPINALLTSMMLDFGTSRMKRMRSAYLGYTSNNELVLKVRSVSDGQLSEHWYKAKPVSTEAPGVGFMPVGQGLKSRYWQFELTNVDGADFEIDEIELHPLFLGRRI